MVRIENVKREENYCNNSKCRKCKYMAKSGGEIICYYIVHEKKRRNCPVGELCTKFKEGKPERIDYE